GSLLDLRGNPDTVLVGARRRVVPEAVHLDLTLGARERRKPGLTRGLPVDILDVGPFLGVEHPVVLVEDDVAGLLEGSGLDVTHSRITPSFVGGQHVLTGPT